MQQTVSPAGVSRRPNGILLLTPMKPQNAPAVPSAGWNWRIKPPGGQSHNKIGTRMPPAKSELAPTLKAPAGTCDTHMHIYDHRFPKAPTAKILAPDASVSDYLKMRARLGIERTVVVQPSAYGKDNRCTLEAMAAIGPSARGIAVVDETVTDAELDRLTRLGIRGIRLFMLAGAPLPWEILETMVSRVAPFGWHVQL